MHPLVAALRGWKPPCSRCGQPNPRAPAYRYCKPCNTIATREWRAAMPPDVRDRERARAFAGIYKRRGKLPPQPCRGCGDDNLEAMQMHHHDYSKPLEVIWLCRKCHIREHHGAPFNELRVSVPNMGLNRKNKRTNGQECSRCSNPPRAQGQRLCAACHAAAERDRYLAMKAKALAIVRDLAAPDPGVDTIDRPPAAESSQA